MSLSVRLIQLEGSWTDMVTFCIGRYLIGIYLKIAVLIFLQLVIPTWRTNLCDGIDASATQSMTKQWCMVINFWKIQRCWQ